MKKYTSSCASITSQVERIRNYWRRLNNDVSQAFRTTTQHTHSEKNHHQVQLEDTGIYQLQHITINSKSYLVFFKTGCSDFVVRSKAIPLLHNRATLQHKGPITLGGIGDASATSSNGIYSVIKDIHTAYTNTGGNPSTLPTLPSIIGGDVYFMVGIKYLRYYPQQVFQPPSGLNIYQSRPL